MFDNNKALRAVQFIELLKHTKDPFYGQPFKLLPWQREVVETVYGTMDDDGHRQYQYCYLEIPKKNGKALSVDTLIPTAAGYKTMGELKVGDKVFDEKGKLCNIIACTDVMYDRPCYKLLFSDGTEIIADANHQWLTNAWVDRSYMGPNVTRVNDGERRYKGSITRVRTTEEIANTLKVNKGTTNNHSVTVAEAIDLPDAELPIPPYTLGAWLGDGCSNRASIICCDKDLAIIEKIKADGVDVKKYKSPLEYGLTDGVRNSSKDCIQKRLRDLGVFNNKHIPILYKRASINQRMELLRGLMDTDGYCSKDGQCEYTSVKKTLAEDVRELVASLGYKVKVNESIAKCNGKDCGPKYRVQFWGDRENSCFALPRKTERLKSGRTTRNGVRHIVECTPIESVPVKCIEVDSDSHLYLATKSFIPTHNSELGAAIALYHLFADGVRRGEIYSCAADRGQASLVFDVACDMIEQNPYLKKRSKITKSKRQIEDKVSGSIYKVLSAEAYTKHGLNVSAVIFDELHTQPNRELWDVMTQGSGDARLEPLWYVITTAGDDPDRHSIGWEVHERAKKIIDGTMNNPRWYCRIWGLEPDFEGDIYDEDLWYKVNPSLGYTIDISKVRQMALEARNDPATERRFRQLRLNQWISNKTFSWLPLDLWDSTSEPMPAEALIGKRCYLGLDLSATTDLTAIALLFPPQDGLDSWYFKLETFIPMENAKEKEQYDGVPYRIWESQKFVTMTSGDVIDYDYIEARIVQLHQLYNVNGMGNDPWGAEKLRQDLERDYDITMMAVTQNIANFSPAMKEIERLLRRGELRHEVNPLGRWTFGNVVLYIDGNGNIKPMKNKATGRIDPIVALIVAMNIAMKNEEQESVYDTRGILVI